MSVLTLGGLIMLQALDNYRKEFDALLPEINANIERYRKGSFTVKVVDHNGNPVSAKIRAEQKGHAFDFGTSVLMLGNMGEREQEYRDAVSNLFNLVTTTFCWNIMETEPGRFRFKEGSEEIYRRPPSDRVLKFAKENDMKVKGQPLFCGRWCPSWVPQDIDKLKELWIKFVRAVADRYDGEYSIFDVVNESYQTRGSWNNMGWLPESISDFVRWLLKAAGEIFSNKCILERNETTRVNYGEYADIYYNENKKLLEDGVRLDSIGFQFHFFNGNACLSDHISGVASPKNIYDTYQRMSTLGVPLYITEITIPTVYKDMSLEEGEELQAEILEKLYRLWFSVPNMQGIVYWNLKDGDAWANEADCRGCLIDENMRRKKSYQTLERLIKREWNTCVTDKTNENGNMTFSGFYGRYDISVDVDGKTTNHDASFDKETDTLTIVI